MDEQLSNMIFFLSRSNLLRAFHIKFFGLLDKLDVVFPYF